MNDEKNISTSLLEEKITEAGDKFTLASVARALGSPRSDVLRRRLERLIESGNDYFYDKKWNCIKRESFFTGREFIITPDEWEITQGVLFPGHRFIPFLPDTVFPSDVKLLLPNGEELPKRKITLPLGKIFHYHLLLGSEQIFDYLIAEDPANAHLAHHANSNEQVTLEVFDLATFYRALKFSAGDAVCCQVVDYSNGIVKCRPLAADERSFNDRKKRIAALDEAIKQVWEEFRDYPDIPEQLAWAEYYSGESSSTGASIDEFISQSAMVELRADGDHAVLSIREADKISDDPVLPEGLSISNAALDDPLKLLSGSGIALTEAELDSFMLDAINKRETDFDGVYSRIFAHRELDMNDEAQQAVLLNYLEERFEELLENYNRADDEPKAELRSDLVEAISERLELLSYFGSLDRELNEKETALLKALAGVSTRLNEALKLLNNPAFTPDEIELERLATLVDAGLDEQEELLSEYHSSNSK